MALTVPCRALVAGTAAGEALALDEPLSLWGGLDPGTGRIVEPRHPQFGATVTGRVLVMAAGRGSSSSSSVLAEAVRLGTAPAAIVLGTADSVLVVGALVARELDGTGPPIVVVESTDRSVFRTGVRIDVTPTRLTVAIADVC